MVKPGNTAKQGACSEPGPGEASGSIQLTLEEQEKDASGEVEEQPGSEVRSVGSGESGLLSQPRLRHLRRGARMPVPEAEQDPRGRVP